MVENRSWLRPWEATNPDGPTSFDVRGLVINLVQQCRRGEALTFVIHFDGEPVGLINVANIVRGSLSSAIIGYWISQSAAGNSVTPIAVALTVDYLFNVLGLHRAEIAIRPENANSLRVVEKLGLRFEGLKERYIHINYEWRDHKIFAITSEEVPDGLLSRLTNKSDS